MRTVALTLMLTLVAPAAVGCGEMFSAKREVTMHEAWKEYSEISIRTRNGSIELNPGGSDVSLAAKLSVRGETQQAADANLEKLKVVMQPDPKDASVLSIELIVPDELKRFSPGGSFVVSIPTASRATLTTSNGSISVSGMKDELRLNTSNGSIRATTITGRIRAESSNGALVLHDVQGEIEADTSNGKIEIAGAVGRVKAETSNGPIQIASSGGAVTAITSNGAINVVATPGPTDSVLAESSNGSCKVRVPAEWSGQVELETSNGAATLTTGTAKVNYQSKDRKHVVATLNDGGAAKVVAKSSNASVTVEIQ